jgi:hypothetical protein
VSFGSNISVIGSYGQRYLEATIGVQFLHFAEMKKLRPREDRKEIQKETEGTRSQTFVLFCFWFFVVQEFELRQGLHLAALHQLYFCDGFFEIGS